MRADIRIRMIVIVIVVRHPDTGRNNCSIYAQPHYITFSVQSCAFHGWHETDLLNIRQAKNSKAESASRQSYTYDREP